MKHLKIALGLTLAVGLTAAIASPAMATPRLVHCVKVEKGKWLNNNCTEAGAGTWETKELAGTSEVTSSGELELEDTGTGVAIRCSGEGTGWVANLTTGASKGGVTSITNAKCKVIAGSSTCEELKKIEARNLPWGGRLVESGSEVRDELISGNSSGAPGWAIECKTVIGTVTDICTRSGSTQNVRANRTNGKTEAIFDKISEEKKERANCTTGGAETGRVSGTILGQLRGLTAFWILAPNLKT